MKKQTTTGRQLLQQLEKTRKFVFHGSSKRLTKLQPRQQMNRDYKLGRLRKDGRPTVCATPYADTAIFHAVVSPLGWTSFGITSGKMILRSSPGALRRARQKKTRGYVYLFTKSNFRRHSPYEYRVSHSIEPLAVVKVTANDIPGRIQVIRDWKTWSPYAKKHWK